MESNLARNVQVLSIPMEIHNRFHTCCEGKEWKITT
jgi:hypothetical protein